MSKVHSIGSSGCRLARPASGTIRDREDNTVFISLIAHLKELNKLANPRVANLKRDKHWDTVGQLRRVAWKSRSNVGAESQADQVARPEGFLAWVWDNSNSVVQEALEKGWQCREK